MSSSEPQSNRGQADTAAADAGQARLSQGSSTSWRLTLGGVWTRDRDRPAVDDVLQELQTGEPSTLALEEDDLSQWDSTLLAYLLKLVQGAEDAGISVDVSGLRDGLRELLRLARTVPERDPSHDASGDENLLARFGHWSMQKTDAAVDTTAFVGETAIAFGKLLLGRARYRQCDMLDMLYFCGPDALMIISLIAFLMGLILAFVGAIQLRLFGAEIYVADLVGIGIVRAMAAIMTGVVMSGRSGAAFAAQLGTMQANDEIDALRTLGLNPVEFLVLPRLVALTLMMPLLCLCGNAMGVVGGMVVGVGMLDLGLVQYWNETLEAVGMNDLIVGVVMGLVFGVLVSVAGCLRGMQAERSSASVGQAATSAVVTSIVWIVVATALITVICDVLGV